MKAAVLLDVSLKMQRKEETHATRTNPNNPARRGCSAVAGESVHSHAVIDQVNLEQCCGDCRGFVAPERLRSLSFRVPYPPWIIRDECREDVGRSSEHSNKQYEQIVGRHLPKEIF